MALTDHAPPRPRYLRAVVTVVSVVTGLGIFVWISIALAALGGRTGAVCQDPPSLTGQLPQLLIVGTSVAAFVVGGLTSVWPVRPSHPPTHPHVRDGMAQRRVRMAVRLALVGLLLIVTGLLLIEFITMTLHVWPITYYVRCSNEAHSPLSALGAGIYAFLAGRWLWVWR